MLSLANNAKMSCLVEHFSSPVAKSSVIRFGEGIVCVCACVVCEEDVIDLV